MVATVHFVAVLLGVAAAVSVSDEYFEGDGTSYTLNEVSSGNCNFMSVIPTAPTHFVALNEKQWNTLGNCGRCIEVSCIDEQCTAKNKTAVVQVLDRCPECAHGALDLSPTVFSVITGLGPNRLKIRWRFVDCPSAGNVHVCLKEGSSSSWIAVQPTNGLVGIKSVTLNGAATTMLDGAYFYVSTTANADLSAVKVVITSVNGDVISGTYSLSVGHCTDTMKQFASGSSSQTAMQNTPEATTPALAAVTPKITPVTPVSQYTPATPEAQGPSKGATPATLKDTPVTPTSQYTPATPEAQGPSTEATPESTTSEATTPVPAASTPKITPVTPTSEYTPVTPKAQGPSTEATPESTTPEATTPATTATPKDTPATPEAQGPSMKATSEAPTTSPEAPTSTDAPAPSDDTLKCHVTGHK